MSYINGINSTAANSAYETATGAKDESYLNTDDFMTLMIVQLQNQDFMEPVDNAQMLEQMATISNMQMMEEMTSYSKTNYAMSLVGKNVTATRLDTNGDLDTMTGKVDQVSLVDNEYIIYVGGKKYTLDQIMSVGGDNLGTVVPSNFEFTAKDPTSDSIVLEWETPTEDPYTASGLKYTVYYSESSDFDTVEQVEAGTQVGSKEQLNIQGSVISFLDSGTTYYANVVVTDASGNKSVYKPVKFTTVDEGEMVYG